MAFDKIIDSTKLDQALTATADAIRSKTGSSDPIAWNSETGFKITIESMEVGGGGVSEWETVMSSTDITFTDGGEYMDFVNVYPLVSGNAYKVIWDGQVFEDLVASDIVFQGMDAIAIGNIGALEGNPSEEPFVIGYIPSVNGFGIFRMDGTDTTTNVAIYKLIIPLPIIQPLEITENGTYTVPDGVDGYSPIVVNVTSSGGSVEGAYTITFMSQDGSLVYGTKLVMHGDTCGDPIALDLFETPTKESTAQYDYTFNGWAQSVYYPADGNALVNITKDQTFYASFASEVRSYTVSYYDGDTLLKTETLAYGSTPTYIPEKENQIFGGWSPDTPVYGDTTYQAQWILDAVANGDAGTNAKWYLTSDGELVIHGSGGMAHSNYNQSSPWGDYKDQIVKVTIEEGITYVGQYAFQNYTNLTSVSMPQTLTTIYYNAFDGCTSLGAITIPRNVSKINAYAFQGCTKLKATFEYATTWNLKEYFGTATKTLYSTTISAVSTVSGYLRSTYTKYDWTRAS